MSGPFSAIGHAVSDDKVGNGGVFVHHNTRAGITQHGVFTELGSHFAQRAGRARYFCSIPDFLQMGWIAGHLLEDGFLMNAGRLGAAADQRIDGADYHVVRDDDRIRHLVDDNLAQASADHLFHG